MNANPISAALLLDGRRDDDPTLALAHDALVGGLAAGGWAVDDWTLRDDKIAWCAGCFKCWTQTPGVCAHHDDGRTVAERWTHSDLVVFLTPVTFGGYSSELKKALDHVIPILQPFMQKRRGETRHPQRYARRRDLLVIGTVPAGQAEGPDAGTFRRLVERNTLNMEPPRWAVGVLESGAGDWEVRVAVEALLAKVGVETARDAVEAGLREVVA
jgi:multimeric flavodoxin WrbA